MKTAILIILSIVAVKSTVVAQITTDPATGNVGIKLNSGVPAYPLDVNGTGQFSGGAKIGNGPIGFYADSLNHAVRAFNVANSGIYIQSYQGSNTYMYMGQMGTYAGKVGIGTVTPGAKLSFGTNSVGSPSIHLYDGAVGNRFGFGIQNVEMQMFVGANSHFSWNKGGELQPSGFNELMRLTILGNLGIGTTTPLTKLHVQGKASFGELLTAADTNRSINLVSRDAVIKILRIDPTNAPALEMISQATQGGPNIAYWDFYSEPSDASFRIRDRQGGENGGKGLDMLTVSHTTGNVGIGTISPTERLAVNGNIKTQKIIVTQIGWADYVLNKEYNLRPLHSLEAFIYKNHHLPNIPSEKEVKEGGLDLGNTQAALLRKIEELTLYIIELNKKVEKLAHKK